MEKTEEVLAPMLSLDLAYATAMKSYDTAIQRVVFWDGILEKIMAWGTPICLAVIGKASTIEIARQHPDWSCVALAAVAFIAAIAIDLKAMGLFKGDSKDNASKFRIQVPDVRVFLEDLAFRPTKEHQLWAAKHAVEANDLNEEFVRRKRIAANWAVLLFAISMTLGAIAWVWSLRGH